MRWSIAKGRFAVYLVLAVACAGVCAWQWQEHDRFERAAAEALINRGRDITSTLGVVVSSQRRFGNLVAKDRIELALQGLIHPGQLESIAILSPNGETIASAGRPVVLTPDMLTARGIHWREHELTLMNLMDLGVGNPTDDSALPAAFVVSDPRLTDPRMNKAYRQTSNRAKANARTMDAGEPKSVPGGAGARFPYSRPAWMGKDEYDALIQKQGVHSLVISLSTDEMRRAVRNDLVLRSLVSLLACSAALISALAWRNVSRNADLQIRLVKAGEMNSHLSQMNFAAAGLAHETRNPLNLIRGQAQLIAMQAQASPNLREHAASIIEEADRVTVQLNEFINYSKPREAHAGPVQIAALTADVLRTLQPDIEEKQIQAVAPTAPLTVMADEPLLRQALFNLLLNAIQAVGAGGNIAIAWSLATPGEATIEIADDGPGVPPAERGAIFKPYVTMRPQGAGLGLAIVQQIVSAHGWSISCEANEPRGAAFRIRHVKVVTPVA